jgi:putative redox protein
LGSKPWEIEMEVKVSQLEGVKFAIEARSHSVISDQPAENGGADAGMTPPEFLLAALGSCAAFYAAEYLRTRNLAYTGLEVTVTAEKLKQPARLGNFLVRVASPVALTPEQTEALMRSVRHCTVHNTLLSPPEIAIELAMSTSPARQESPAAAELG